MRIVKVFAVLAVGLLVISTQTYAQVPFNCSDPPDGGKTPQNLRGALKLGNTVDTDDDVFSCGTSAAATPATCELFNRIYTDSESACINADFIFDTTLSPQDYFPNPGSSSEPYGCSVGERL